MEWDQLESSWQQFEGSARAHWSRLTDDDWQNIGGKRPRLVERLQEVYGITKAESEMQVAEWSEALLTIAVVSKPR